MSILRFLTTRTIHGRITWVMASLALFFALFSFYVLIQNNKIRKNIIILSNHAEPVITLRIAASFIHYTTQAAIFECIAKVDTAGFVNGFYRGIQKEKEILRLIQCHSDSMGFLGLHAMYDSVFQDIEIYEREANIIFNAIGKARASGDSTVIMAARNTNLSRYYDHTNRTFLHILQSLNQDANIFKERKETLVEEVKDVTHELVVVLVCGLVCIIVFSILAWRSISQYFLYSMDRIVSVLNNLAKGQLTTQQDFRKDEVGEILSATNQLTANLQLASDFASSIGKGDFNHSFEPTSTEDTLGHALVQMRDSLQKFKLEDEQRLWVNQGFAHFGAILRQNNQNIGELTSIFISDIVKYLSINQGSIFLASQDTHGDIVLTQTATYAYNRKKLSTARYHAGEGLIGQTFLEKETTYLKEVPDDYIKITSGLGEATPRAVLIVPLLHDQVCLGVLELASFKEFEPYKIDFLNKLAADLASVVSSVQSTEKTNNLVIQLQERTEAMHSQEEEIRQNMEELLATQEELQRKEIDYVHTIEQLQRELQELRTKV